ncbi:phosphomannomutase [Citrobacter koseri]|uniref:phosphomannomutase n=1 Tax=Citrobacter TaxID=544 RepID=UPI000E1472D8|nr:MULTISPECIES: phosphomannomutase [Citrobacter]MBJ8671100.1 phosphomannomutase [Citrobacter koseri]MBJ8763982.1 phosphomannomutase [Citrobacter koseri]MBJ9119875.1 phosphomannomutase [Citrobacter koseri]MBJ9228771.1 phosphomannomutase [Citrobacter koseri]MDM3003068.1 phosphomannomutase [Citrobacter sp. CK188]
MLNTQEVIKNSGVTFGTSGARGLVVDFTPDLCAAFVHAFLQILTKRYDVKKVALAIDNRPSSYLIAQACAAAIIGQGHEVEFQGTIPTPALAYYTAINAIPGIMVTGSHIPFDRNGLKFYRPDGEISKSDESAILSEVYHFPESQWLPNLIEQKDAADLYVKRYTSLFDSSLLAGKMIGIYEHSSAGRDIYPLIFKQLGAEIISLGRSDEFVPIDTEAVSDKDRALAQKWVHEYQLDAIFSTDGDGDRPLISDENGEWLRGDILGLLASLQLNIQALAVPLSCNTAIELTSQFRKVERTRIGSPYVISAFADLKDYQSVAGFEANGGFLLASDINVNSSVLRALPTRDAVLPALMLLVRAKKEKISDIVKSLPARFTWSDRIQNFPAEKNVALFDKIKTDPDGFISDSGFASLSVKDINLLDGIRLTLNNDDILHLRASGNAPELRCYAESTSEMKAKQYVNITISNIETSK